MSSTMGSSKKSKRPQSSTDGSKRRTKASRIAAQEEHRLPRTLILRVDLLEMKKGKVPPVKLDAQCYHTIPEKNGEALTTESSFERVKRAIQDFIYCSEKTVDMNLDVDEETISTGGYFVCKVQNKIVGNRRCDNLEPIAPETHICCHARTLLSGTLYQCRTEHSVSENIDVTATSSSVVPLGVEFA
jgi:hypothetical protein